MLSIRKNLNIPFGATKMILVNMPKRESKFTIKFNRSYTVNTLVVEDNVLIVTSTSVKDRNNTKVLKEYTLENYNTYLNDYKLLISFTVYYPFIEVNLINNKHIDKKLITQHNRGYEYINFIETVDLNKYKNKSEILFKLINKNDLHLDIIETIDNQDQCYKSCRALTELLRDNVYDSVNVDNVVFKTLNKIKFRNSVTSSIKMLDMDYKKSIKQDNYAIEQDIYNAFKADIINLLLYVYNHYCHMFNKDDVINFKTATNSKDLLVELNNLNIVSKSCHMETWYIPFINTLINNALITVIDNVTVKKYKDINNESHYEFYIQNKSIFTLLELILNKYKLGLKCDEYYFQEYLHYVIEHNTILQDDLIEGDISTGSKRGFKMLFSKLFDHVIMNNYFNEVVLTSESVLETEFDNISVTAKEVVKIKRVLEIYTMLNHKLFTFYNNYLAKYNRDIQSVRVHLPTRLHLQGIIKDIPSMYGSYLAIKDPNKDDVLKDYILSVINL